VQRTDSLSQASRKIGVASHETLAESSAQVEGRDRIEQFVLAFLAAANVFDMGGSFGLKYASYVLCALFLVLRIREIHMPRRVFLVCVVLFLIWPLISAIRGVGQGGDLGRALQRITAFLPALLVLPVVVSSRQPRFLVDAVMGSLLAMAVVMICFFCVLLVLPDLPHAREMMASLRDQGQGYFGVRSIGSIVIPNVYFTATLFLVPACVWFLFCRRYLASGLCFMALVLGFSRSGVLLAAIVCFSHLFIFASLRVRTGLLCVLGLIIFLLWRNAELLQLGSVLGMYLDVLTGQGASAAVRGGHFQSIVGLLADDPIALWLGQGAGVAFFSTGTNAFVTAVELDHLDAIRTYGLIWFIAFTIVVLRAVGVGMHLQSEEARGLRVAVLAGFFAAGTNPVLINPLFCMLVAASYAYLSANTAATAK
jgi:hypothetical protein